MMMKKQLLSLFLFLLCTYANATVYYVKTNGNDANNGTTWTNAYLTLQKALDVTIANDEIWVATGTYVPTKNKSGASVANAAENTFYINKNIKIYGGFAGNETDISQRIKGSNITTLSGDMNADGIKSNNAYNIFYIDGTTATGNITNNCVIDGFILADGYPYGKQTYPFEQGGGGVYIKADDSSCSPKIANCTFTGHFSTTDGAALYLNVTSGLSNLVIDNCTFPEGQDYAVSLKFDFSLYFGFDAAKTSQIKINNCSFYKSNGPLKVYNFGNSSVGATVNLELSNSKFSETSNQGTGGPLRFSGFSKGTINAKVINCVFNKNSSTGGPATFFIDANSGANINSEFTNNTFYKNTGAAVAGVINHSNSGGTLNTKVTNTIFFANNLDGNGVPTGNEINSVGATTINVSYSMTQQNSVFATGTGNIDNQNPQFVDANNGDFRLLSGSPALNAGTSVNAPSTDIAGNMRPQGTGIDMGAYEGIGTLPVNLIAFSAKADGNSALLQWQTASENNNHHYVIERSSNGKTFNHLAKIATKGNTNNTSVYSYRDSSPLTGANYYQLTQVDNDGKQKELDVKSVNFSINDLTYQTYPNPIKNEFFISLPNATGSKKIIILDLSGKVVFDKTMPVLNGTIDVQLVENFKKGIYVVDVEGYGAKKIIVE